MCRPGIIAYPLLGHPDILLSLPSHGQRLMGFFSLIDACFCVPSYICVFDSIIFEFLYLNCSIFCFPTQSEDICVVFFRFLISWPGTVLSCQTTSFFQLLASFSWSKGWRQLIFLQSPSDDKTPRSYCAWPRNNHTHNPTVKPQHVVLYFGFCID